MGRFSLKPGAGPNQRAAILKRGVLGIAAVVLVAFAVSFLGGGDAQNAQSQRPSEPESLALDTKALLEAEPDTQASAAAPIPANRKFDYEAADNSGALSPADTPIAVTPSPAENSGNVEVSEPAAASLPIPAIGPVDAAPSEDAPAQNVKPAQGAGTAAVLFCGKFGTSQSAEERKAMLAFQGKSSTVVKRGSGYSLKIGPFKNREAARAEFAQLDAGGLVNECSLEDDNQ